MDNTIDVEAQPAQTTSLAIQQAQPPPAPAMFKGDPATVVEQATTAANILKDVIRKQGLISKISNKEYPRCEAWTLLGSMLGIFPVLQWSRQVPGGWEARVEAKTLSGAVVGAAEALCLRSERNWKDRDDFALRSMAQTRATAKALRMPLGFVMTLAGFEPTPAEEMVADHPQIGPGQSGRSPDTTQAPKAPEKPVSVAKPATVDRMPTEESRANMIAQLKAGPDGANRNLVTTYFEQVGQIMPLETVEELPLRFVPATQKEMRLLAQAIAAFESGEEAKPAFAPHPPQAQPDKPIEVPRDKAEPQDDQDAWRTFPMPFGKNAGVALEDLEKNYLFGLWANYTVETEYNGKPKREETIAKDTKFRQMLDLAGQHYEFKKKD